MVKENSDLSDGIFWILMLCKFIGWHRCFRDAWLLPFPENYGPYSTSHETSKPVYCSICWHIFLRL